MEKKTEEQLDEIANQITMEMVRNLNPSDPKNPVDHKDQEDGTETPEE